LTNIREIHRKGIDVLSGDQKKGRGPSPIRAGLFGKCPQCGKGNLFKGFIDLDEQCSQCGLDYGFADAGDGPAVFVMLIVGFICVGAALWVELTFSPPLWVHGVIWLPVILGLSLGLLRPMKALLIALQFKNKARSGKMSDD